MTSPMPRLEPDRADEITEHVLRVVEPTGQAPARSAALPGLIGGSSPDPGTEAAPTDSAPGGSRTLRAVQNLKQPNRFVRRMTGGHGAPTSTVQDPVIRRTLNPTQILTAVDGVPALKGRLDGRTEGQQRNKGSAETIRQRVEKVLDEHQAMFDGDDAMSIALVVDAIAKAVAEELYDMSLKSGIATHLLDTFADQIKQGMTKKGRRTKDLKKAKAIVSVDALSLYMHDERKVTDAAWDIKDAAAKGRMTPLEMFGLLDQKFQAELASYNLQTISAEQDKKGGFNQSEITGSVSVNYLKELFGDNITAQPDQKMPKKPGGRSLQFTPESQLKLGKLRQAVIDATPDTAVDPRPTTPKERQKRLLDDIQEKDDAIRQTREAAVHTALLAAPWNLTAGKATKLINTLKSKLPTLPLTITHSAAKRLPADVDEAIDTRDRSRAGVTESKDVEGKNFDSPGKWTGGQRGEDYLRFRTWKDRVMTGNLGQKGDEMPVFGAVNVNFKNYKGSIENLNGADTELRDLHQKGKKNWTEKDKKDLADNRKYRDKRVGTNYYGDLHLVLERSAVADRVIYTASDHGQAHRDPFLVFADFLLGSQGDYQADLTKLKRTGAGGFTDKSGRKALDNSTEIVQPEFAAAIVGSVLGSVKAAAWTLPFEIQIHGGVDWETDVKEIWVAPSTAPEHVQRLRDWSKGAKGRPKVKVAKAPPESTIVPLEDLAASGRKRARR